MSIKKINKIKISLDSPIQKKLTSSVLVNEINVRRIIEKGKKVVAFTNERGNLTLFEGDSYNPDWTESDAINRIKELVS